MKDIFRVAPHVAPARRAEAALRRRDHRRRLARPRDRVLPRARTTGSRTSPCSRRATSAPAPPGRNTTIIRSNYRTPEGAAFYKRERQALRAALARTSTSTCCSRSTATSRSRTPTARCHDAAERAEVNQLLGIDSPRRSSATRSRSSARELNLSDDATWPILRRALPPARRDHPPRRRRLGLRARRRPAAASRSTSTPR